MVEAVFRRTLSPHREQTAALPAVHARSRRIAQDADVLRRRTEGGVLGNRYGRVFTNHWEFVRYAQEQHLDLDLTSPPKRWRRP